MDYHQRHRQIIQRTTFSQMEPRRRMTVNSLTMQVAWWEIRTSRKPCMKTAWSRAFQACQQCPQRRRADWLLFLPTSNPMLGKLWFQPLSALDLSSMVVGRFRLKWANQNSCAFIGALASSVWLVCKKRQAEARPGWDNQVLEEMRRNIREKLREFWDAGIRGPDFVWAATGPALGSLQQASQSSRRPTTPVRLWPFPSSSSMFAVW